MSVFTKIQATGDHDSTVLASDVESIMKAIIETSKNEAQAQHLLGVAGGGKSSDNDIDHYNLDILEHTKELGGPNKRSFACWSTMVRSDP